MKLIPTLKELFRHKRWVALGPVIAALLVVGITNKVASASKYTATKQVLVDSADSSVPDASKNLAQLIPRAGIYAQIMTNTEVMNLIGKAAGIPGDEIAATGPSNTFGQSATHPATVASPGGYALMLTLPNSTQQPIISIAAQAMTRAKAIALANGGAIGLNQYVTRLATDFSVPSSRRISIRDLGVPTVSSVSSGIPTTALPLIFLLGVVGWCVLLLFAIRFIRTWKNTDLAISQPFPSEYDKAFLEGTTSGSASSSGEVAAATARNGSSRPRLRPAPEPPAEDVPLWSDDEAPAQASSINGPSFASDLFLSRRTR